MGLIDDITANGKGQALALVGILAGVFVLGGFSFFQWVVQDESFVGKGQSIEARLVEQKDQIAELHSRIHLGSDLLKSGKEITEEADKTVILLRAAESDLAAKNQLLASLTSEIKKLEESYQNHRQEFQERAYKAAIGQKLPLLVLKSGRRYENATITRVSAAGIELSYPDGLARVAPAELDSSWQHRFDW